MNLSNYQFCWHYKQILDPKYINTVECSCVTFYTANNMVQKKQRWISWKIHYVAKNDFHEKVFCWKHKKVSYFVIHKIG